MAQRQYRDPDPMAATPRPRRSRPGVRPRRLLALLALAVVVVALLNALAAATGEALRHGARSGDAAGAVGPLGPLPQLCSACVRPSSQFYLSGAPTLTHGPDGVVRVDPQRIAASEDETPPDRRFGVVQAFASPHVASYAGVGWERINFDWSSLQPTGPREWNRAAVSGAMLAQEIAAGRAIVGIIGGPPHWAVDARGLPRGLYLPPDDPRNRWGTFVAQLVRRYRGRVRDWIVWNEPDVWDPHNGGYTWPGSVDDFARLEEVAYVQIKRVDPSLVVHLAATTYWWDAAYGRPLYFGRLLDALARAPHARAHNWYFDVASAHIYNVPDDVERILTIDRNLMRAHGFDKPIWLVETNAMPTRDGPWAMVNPRWLASAGEQSAYIPQAFALALAAGAERVSVYKMADPAHLSAQAYPVGLVRPDGTARPVVAALRATTYALAGWVSARDDGTVGPARVVAVDRGARGTTLVVWNTGPEAATLTLRIAVPPGATAAWLDAHVVIVRDDDTRLPASATVSDREAVLRVALAPSTCAQDHLCRIGGPPLLVMAPTLPSVQVG